jgi:hypothetical protein
MIKLAHVAEKADERERQIKHVPTTLPVGLIDFLSPRQEPQGVRKNACIHITHLHV